MKRLPSVKTLSRVFSDPKRARAILEMSHAELSETEAGAARIKECWHHPKWHDVRMHVMNSIEPSLHGIESFQVRNGEYVEYLNAGDPYAATLLYRSGRYFIGTWGYIAERET